jgi:UDP-N-acetylmuramyl pentapeptide phosphotransferase/UDP-N-acetylglucosamine-1-phosphate transferase
MNFLILSFLISLLVTLGLIRYQHLHENITSDHDLSGPQKFHTQIVPRVGGIGIFLALLVTSICALVFFKLERGALLLQLTACALPSFLVGLLEDVTKKIGVKTRLIATAISAGLAGYFLNSWISDLHVPIINDLLMISFLSMAFTIIAITGLANAYNIIDGFNGLASMVAIISLLAIGYIAFKVNDPILASACLIVIGAIGGFFIWNYPRGLIFLGDGGAYLIGFFIAVLSILLVKRNPSVSPWFALLVNAYPIFETLFTIWRRKVHQGKNPGLPDGAHFHSLIYRRLIRWAEVHQIKESASYAKNAKTSPYLWLLSSFAVFPAIIWWDSTWVLQCFALLFCVSYVWVYNAVVKFKTPSIFKWFR